MLRRKVIPGESLADTHPDIALRWHQAERPDLTPADVMKGSNEVVDWRCDHGHIEQRRVTDQVANKGKCLLCQKLGHTHPDIAAEIAISDGGPKHAWQLSSTSKSTLNWKCKTCDEEWSARVKVRCHGLSGACPRCTAKKLGAPEDVLRPGQMAARGRELKKALAGNNLLALYPEVAAELHPELNGELDPATIPPSSKRPAWFLCPSCGQEYSALLSNRTRKRPGPTGCPACARQSNGEKTRDRRKDRAAAGENLVKLYPRVAAELLPERNDGARPEEFTPGMDDVLNWTCSTCKHEWRARVAGRTSGRGCPECWKLRRIEGARTRSLALASSGRNLEALFPKIAKEWHPTKNNGIQACDVRDWPEIT